MPAERTVFLVMTNAVEGREAEFNDWYDGVHIPEVLALPGWRSVQRFELAPTQREGRGPAVTHRFLSIYEFEGDGSGAMAALASATASGALRMSSAMAPDVVTTCWTATGDPRAS